MLFISWKREFEISLEPFVRVHDLDREGVFTFARTANSLTVARDQGNRFIPARERGARVPHGLCEHLVGLARYESRQVWSETSTTSKRGQGASWTTDDLAHRSSGPAPRCNPAGAGISSTAGIQTRCA